MRLDHLVEPVGLLHGRDAADAIAAGDALPFLGGAAAFALARLHGPGAPAAAVRATAIAGAWSDALARVTAAPASAGLPPGPHVMGILNATPDSFSDPGLYLDPAVAIAAGRRFVAEGATVLDIGGESTRPGALPPALADEIARVAPILDGLRGCGALLSVDTRRVPVMQAALAHGADIVNDVSGLAFDPEAIPCLAHETCAVVLMHMRGTPETMRDHARYEGDLAATIVRELGARVDEAVAGGIAPGRILVDPGIGFAKTAEQGLELLRRLPILANLGARLVLGVSRKSFIARVAGIDDPHARTPGSLAAGTAARGFPGTLHRVHDIASTRQFLLVEQALLEVAVR